jgi:FtsH-binding integral membrane protein
MYPDVNSRRNPIIIEASTHATTNRLSQVLLISSLGFLVTAFGVYMAPPFLAGGGILGFLVILGLVFAVNATRRSPALSLSLFLLLALVFGFMISPEINMFLRANRSDIVFNAALTTAVGMGVLGVGAQFARFDYRRLSGIAMAALLALVIAGVLGMFFHFVNPTFYSWATLAIFSVLIVVDFMRIRKGGDGLTPVQLALSIYLDGLNVFLALLQIFGNGSGGSRRR